MRPPQPQQIQLKLIHIRRLSIQQKQQPQHRRLRPRLPPIHRVMTGTLAMFLEMQFLDLLPAGHDAGAAADFNLLGPEGVEVAVGHGADVRGAVGEGY